MVILSEFRMGQYEDDDHREHARCVTHPTLRLTESALYPGWLSQHQPKLFLRHLWGFQVKNSISTQKQ